MIQGKNIVCLGFPSWDGDYMKAIVQILSVLARNNNVLYVDYQYTHKDMVMSMLGKGDAPVSRMLGFKKRLRTITVGEGAEVKILTLPPVYPINWLSPGKMYETLLKQSARTIKKAVRKTLRQLNIEDPIIINSFNPVYGLNLIDQFDEELLLYYCYDEISHAEWCKKHGPGMEARFAPKVDAVVTTSEQLRISKTTYNEQCFLVRNGVDLAIFEQAFIKKNERDAHDKDWVVGYLGTVDDRLDYDLLEHCIKASPNMQFHFVGRITHTHGKERLKHHSNVHFFGAQSPDKLPEFVSQFDVGVIPFVSNGFTRSIYPLKINEYLAAGLPVVTTNFSILDDFKEVVSIETQPKEFLDAILKEKELANNPHEYKQATKNRIAFAQSNSWENRAEELSQVIEKITTQKKTVSQKTY